MTNRKYFLLLAAIQIAPALLYSYYLAEGNKLYQYPFIEFREKVISFDTITAGEKVVKEFYFQNKGPGKLTIRRVNASDGGTMAFWPKTQILPGDNKSIQVVFNFTASRSGYQDKIFTVISNAKNNGVELHLKGFIKRE